MRGNIWAVVAVGTLLAISPAVLEADTTTLGADLVSLYDPLAVVAGLVLLLVAIGALIRVAFAGGGAW